MLADQHGLVVRNVGTAAASSKSINTAQEALPEAQLFL